VHFVILSSYTDAAGGKGRGRLRKGRRGERGEERPQLVQTSIFDL
jgi:hypothetical protein